MNGRMDWQMDRRTKVKPVYLLQLRWARGITSMMYNVQKHDPYQIKYTLQWCHVSIMVYQITRHLTNGSVAYSGYKSKKHQSCELPALCIGLDCICLMTTHVLGDILAVLPALCEVNPSMASGLSSQSASNAESVSTSWCRYVPATQCMLWLALWPNDAIWWHRSGSTLAQVMACCLTAPSHYLNQCWIIITEV